VPIDPLQQLEKLESEAHSHTQLPRRFPPLPAAVASVLLVGSVILLFELLERLGIAVPNLSLILLFLVIYVGVSGGILAAFASMAVAIGYTSFELSSPAGWLQFTPENGARMISSIIVGIGMAALVGLLHRRAERRIDRAVAAAAIAARDDFIAIAAHDLKTPLTGLLLRAQMTNRRLTGERADLEEAVEALSEIERHGRRMNGMIDRLLDVSRIDAGGLGLEMEDVDAVTILQQALEPLLTAYPGRIQQSMPDVCPARLDPIRFGQLVSNLVENAIRYNGDGPPVEVSLQLAPDGNSFSLSVRDHGPGVPPELGQRIFERSLQGNDDRVGKLGLGLYITKHIALEQGGDIRVDRASDGGAIFTVTLPIEPASRRGRSGNIRR